MAIAIGSKGTFNAHNIAGYHPEITKGQLYVTLIFADGAGSTTVLAHEQDIEVDETRLLLFEGHAREILAYMTEMNAVVNFANLGNMLEHISALFTNSKTDSAVRAVLGAPEGVIATINVKGGSQQIPVQQNGATIRYKAATHWLEVQASPWRTSGTLTIDNGVKTEEIGVLGKK